MEPQDNGYNKPNLTSDRQNPVEWWQPPAQSPIRSTDTSQTSATSQSSAGSDRMSSQHGLPYSVPAQANDSDLVEKEWVDAAKRIMETYRTDPYNKNRTLTLLRADYLKKRYNKDIKISEN